MGRAVVLYFVTVTGMMGWFVSLVFDFFVVLCGDDYSNLIKR